MEVKPKASLGSAFLVGVVTFIPILIFKNYTSFGAAGNFVLSFTFLVYIFTLFAFVHGPAHWETYAFFPDDGVFQALKRGIMWLLGCAISVGLLEISHAI